MAVWVLRLIPAYTGQIQFLVKKAKKRQTHPRVHGADTKFPKKISATDDQLLPPYSSMTESVCVIFLECVFADNTFWSKTKKGRRCVLRWSYPAPNADILTWRLSWQMSWIFLCRFRVAVFFCWLLRYPRAHRANLPLRPTVPEVTGSSPYIRGRRSLHKMNGFLHRCIPVHTGQIFHPKIQALCSEIHPRTHGADAQEKLKLQQEIGSSPHTRGRH